jgi:Leucine-rich repeat (LRR) protein
MECLEYIDFEETSIKELPSSIGNLIGAKELNLGGCTNLTNLPNSIHQLQHLELLNLNGCTSLKWLPSSYGYLIGFKN